MRRILLPAALLPCLAAAQDAPKQPVTRLQLATAVESYGTPVKDPAILGYVERIAQKVAAPADLKVPLTVKVMSGVDTYAVTLPGGYCFVSTKLILAAANEAELAGAIAHQVAHLALWKGRESDLPGVNTIMTVGGSAGLCGRSPVRMGFPVSSLADQRRSEAPADTLGLGYMDKAGYDPGALADIYERILKREPGTVSQVFSVGPLPAATRKQADALRGQRTFAVPAAEFDEIRRKVQALTPPPSPSAPSLRSGH